MQPYRLVRRTILFALASVTGLLAAVTVSVSPVAAAPAAGEYVALGDSYASGLGTREYDGSSGACKRSPHAYAPDSAARLGSPLTFQACAGARVPDVRGQLGALDPATAYVTVQVGGNDAGFSSVVTECAKPAWAQDCEGAVAGARQVISQQLPGSLGGLYGEIRAAAPSAVVVVVGYPRLFGDEDCNAGTFFSPADRALLNDTADLLNARLSSEAGAAGFGFVDPTSTFVGHAVCGDPEYVNGLSNPVDESYHPNRVGQDAYGDLVSAALT